MADRAKRQRATYLDGSAAVRICHISSNLGGKMLRDDAIRQGRLAPTKEDIDRMRLSKEKVAKIKSKNKDFKDGTNRGHSFHK